MAQAAQSVLAHVFRSRSLGLKCPVCAGQALA